MDNAKKARAVGLNHVALEVGDIGQALAFYGRLFDFELRGKSGDMAFIDLGDQFLALQKGRTQSADDGRHFGLVVDDKEAVRKALADAGIEPLPGPFLDFLDPWGNRIEIVSYENVQFTKAPNVLRGMGLTHLSKNEKAIKELTDKGMAPQKDPMQSTLITGANRGIGFEFARQYLADGWQVYAACRDSDAASDLRRLADPSDHKLRIIALDVTDPTSVKAAAAELEGKAIDVLVNNAGVGGPRGQSIGNIDYETWARVLDVNTLG